MKIVPIEKNLTHIADEMQCKNCFKSWVAVYPEGTKVFECPGCGEMVNSFGVAVYINTCKSCDRKFTVVPYPDDLSPWQNCLSDDCPSYNEKRAVEIEDIEPDNED